MQFKCFLNSFGRDRNVVLVQKYSKGNRKKRELVVPSGYNIIRKTSTH